MNGLFHLILRKCGGSPDARRRMQRGSATRSCALLRGAPVLCETHMRQGLMLRGEKRFSSGPSRAVDRGGYRHGGRGLVNIQVHCILGWIPVSFQISLSPHQLPEIRNFDARCRNRTVPQLTRAVDRGGNRPGGRGPGRGARPLPAGGGTAKPPPRPASGLLPRPWCGGSAQAYTRWKAVLRDATPPG